MAAMLCVGVLQNFSQKNISIVVDTFTTSSPSLYCGSPLLHSCATRVDTTPHVSMERNRLAIMKEHTLPADRLQFSVNCCRGNSIWLNIASHVDRNGKAKLSGEKNDIFSHFICPFAHKIARPIILILCSFEAFSAVTHLRKSSFTSDNRHQRSQRIC